MRLSGIVSSGLGRASIFMAQPIIKNNFRNLKRRSVASTLNVKVVESDLSKFIAMREKSGIDTLNFGYSS